MIVVEDEVNRIGAGSEGETLAHLAPGEPRTLQENARLLGEVSEGDREAALDAGRLARQSRHEGNDDRDRDQESNAPAPRTGRRRLGATRQRLSGSRQSRRNSPSVRTRAAPSC